MPKPRYPVMSCIIDRRNGLPPGRAFSVAEHDVAVRDGTVLKVSHYQPTGEPSGTLVMMTPYGRGGAGVSRAAIGMYAGQGYHTVAISLRGTYGSAGRFNPMPDDGDDFRDVITWMRQQPWYTGSFASIGASYSGYTQWALLREPQPDHKAAVIVVGPHDFGEFLWGSGSVTSALPVWASIVNDQERFLLRSLFDVATGGRRVYRWLRKAPVAGTIAKALPRQAWVQDRIAHDDLTDPYWDAMNHSAALERVEMPILIMSGWQDLFVRQSVAQYQRLSERGVDVGFTIGPWAHTTGASSGPMQIQQSFDWLAAKLTDHPLQRTSAVHVHVTGAGQWHDMEQWPPATSPKRWYLGPGTLRPAPSTGEGSFDFDPNDLPVFPGGTLLLSGGYSDDSAVASRPDVLVFSSDTLDADVETHGRPVVVIDRAATHPDADVFCRLSDVDERGRSTNVAEGFLRAHEDGVLRIELTPIAHRFRVGHRVRLAIAGGAHPHFPPNSGTGKNPMRAARRIPNRHTVRFAASYLELATVETRP